MGVKMLPIIIVVAGMIVFQGEPAFRAPTHPSSYTNRRGLFAKSGSGSPGGVCEPSPIGTRRVTENFLTPCRINDIKCLSNTTIEFISNTHKGIPHYDIKPIDPQTIDSFDFEIPELGLIVHMNNLKISGLKDLSFSDLKMDTDKKKVELRTDADLNVLGDLTVENKLRKASKHYGPFTLGGRVSSTARYGFNLTNDCDTNVVHYKVGPETITSQHLSKPEYRIGSEYRSGFSTDPIIQEISERSLRAIAERAYVPVIHNIRAAAKILPASSFLIL